MSIKDVYISDKNGMHNWIRDNPLRVHVTGNMFNEDWFLEWVQQKKVIALIITGGKINDISVISRLKYCSELNLIDAKIIDIVDQYCECVLNSNICHIGFAGSTRNQMYQPIMGYGWNNAYLYWNKIINMINNNSRLIIVDLGTVDHNFPFQALFENFNNKKVNILAWIDQIYGFGMSEEDKLFLKYFITTHPNITGITCKYDDIMEIIAYNKDILIRARGATWDAMHTINMGFRRGHEITYHRPILKIITEKVGQSCRDPEWKVLAKKAYKIDDNKCHVKKMVIITSIAMVITFVILICALTGVFN